LADIAVVEARRIGGGNRPIHRDGNKDEKLLEIRQLSGFASIVTAVLIFSFTGKLLLAVGLGVLDSVVKILVFFLHERVWMAIPFGRIKHLAGGNSCPQNAHRRG
jgi:uncharacterized membrane protein